MSDDELVFAEDEDSPGADAPGAPWKLLVVDDDEEIHSVTTLTLANFEFEGRRLEFLHADSGAEAREILARHPDIAMVLLDVIMETDDAGLEVARYIREELGNRFVRIVLRTGQPGQAPERRVITGYDINDYKEKTELTSTKLYTVVYTGLRAYRDMVDLDRTRSALEAKVAALERAYTDMEAFSHAASHDLQAPLRTIRMFAQDVLNEAGGSLSGEHRGMLERVVAGAGRMQELIRGMLALAAVDAESFQPGAVDLDKIMNEVLAGVEETLQRTRAGVEYDRLPLVMGSDSLLGQLLQNLVLNAIKFQPEGQVPTVRLQAHRQRGMWRISVADNGIGIAPEYVETVFEPFLRLNPRHHYPGTGLGLATCRRIVDRHGGQIWAESTPGEGTTVYFTLPAAP